MTVREWLNRRAPAPPIRLAERVLALLGEGAALDVSQTGSACMEAARQALDSLLAQSRFARADALELLAIDALTTYAFEHASGPDSDPAALSAFATDAVSQLAALGNRG